MIPTATTGPCIRMRLIAFGWLVTTIVVASIWSMPSALASHADTTSPQRHQWKMHQNTVSSTSGAMDEDWCAQTHSPNWTSANAGNVIQGVLGSSTQAHWDGTGNYRIDLWRTPNQCDAYADRSWIEIEYRITDPTLSRNKCGYNPNVYYSCTIHYNPLHTSGQHQDYDSEIVWLYQNHVYDQLINHETGHVWGLLDPGVVDGEADPGCDDSIMHIPFYVGSCGRSAGTPSQRDFDKVVSLMNQP